MDTKVIETVEAIRAADPGDMLGRIKELPQQIRDAWAITQRTDLPPHYGDVRNVTVLGMGGSAIGGDLASALVLDEMKIPFAVHRDYALPAYVGRDSLVIASSYSGNTEETLSGFEEAQRRGARIIVVTTGGKLADAGRAGKFPVITFDYKAVPRATLGYSVTFVLGLLVRLGLVRDRSTDIDTALGELSRLEERVHEGARTNDAKKLALALAGRIVFVYGAGAMGVLARRVKGQLNENSKNWAAFDVMPELNHNAVVGFSYPAIARDALSVLILRSGRDHPRNRLRLDVTTQLLERAGIRHHTLSFEGSSLLSEALQTVLFTDYVSFYVALLNGADPSPHDAITYLKDQLAKS